MRHPHTGLSRTHTRKHVFGLCRPTRMATNPATQSESVKQQPDTPSRPVHTTLYSCLAKPQHVGVCTCIASSRICGQHSLVKHQGNPNSPPYGFHPYWIISLRLQGPPPFPPGGPSLCQWTEVEHWRHPQDVSDTVLRAISSYRDTTSRLSKPNL